MSKDVTKNSPLLINESPLQVLPSLAVALNDVSEAIILQQIQYWLRNPKSGRIGEDGRKYVRDTFDEWQAQFPWLSLSSIKRKLADLKKKEIVLTTNLNRSAFDHTQWYSIDYDRLNQFMKKDEVNLNSSDEVSLNQSDSINLNQSDEVNLNHAIPKTSTKNSISKTSTKNSKKENVPPKGGTTQNEKTDQEKQVDDDIPYKEIINYLNSKTGKELRYTTKSYQRLIKARWNDGYRLKDFKQVIDNKAFSWQGTEFWKFMRPDTLFAPKHFDDYLNENKSDTIPHGGYDIDEEEQKKFLDQVKDEDLPF